MHASGRTVEGGFLVLKGSAAHNVAASGFRPDLETMKDRLIAEGALVPADPDQLEFTQDVLFAAATDATTFILQNVTPPSSAWVHTLPDGQEETYEAWRQRTAGPAASGLDTARLTAAAAWLKTQQKNLERNERAYKLSGAHDVDTRLRAALNGAPVRKVNVQPGSKLNMLGWRTAGGLNALVNSDQGVFREALDELRRDPGNRETVNAFWEKLEPLVAALPDAERRPVSGQGTRASIASYFLFLADPEHHPFYRPSFGGQAVEWLYGRPLDRQSPGHLLQDYLGRCEALLPAFQEAGVPLQDMLDLQGALYIISSQYPGGPRAAQGPATDPVRAEYEAFRADAVQDFRCRVRLARVAHLKEQLSDPDAVTLASFNRDVWRFEADATLDGTSVKGEVYSDHLSADRAAELAAALQQDRLQLHGNYCWGSAAAVYGAPLKISDEEKQNLVRQALRVLNDEALSPSEKAQQVEAVPGFGPNAATGLAMLFHPDAVALNNRPSRDALKALGYDVSTPAAVQRSAEALRDRVGAETFPELDWFLYTRPSGTGYWWVNQGSTYEEESAGGYVWASKETDRTIQHHENVARLKPGDRILHYAGQAIRAVSTVSAPPVEVDGEIQSASIPTKRYGYLAHTEYERLSPPVPISSLEARWRTAEHGPFDKNGNVKQVYLEEASRALFERVTEPQQPAQAWLFQANPKFFDVRGLLAQVQPGDTEEWTVTQYAKDLRVGDPVVIWASGPDGGVLAVTEIAGPVVARPDAPVWKQGTPDDDGQGSLAVPLRFTRILSEAVRRTVIAQHPVLKEMQVMRTPNGTNFKVTQEEWAALQELMDGQPVPPPALPAYETVPFPEIATRLQETGLRIDARTLRRYHLALQTRGFVILSGVSGTGKTWLAEAYAAAAGARVGVFPVAPNWTSNEDLLGFHSPLDGGHYHHTAFSRFLLEAVAEYRAAREAGRTPRPYHLVLDEMNLARVEYYFAQFLSRMELRARHPEREAILTLGPDLTVVLGPNVTVIGTVNVDETTHDFADKVYDRAQLIELTVTREDLEAHLAGHAQRDLILNIWDVLHPVAPFAFRVVDEITEYQRLAVSLGGDALEALDDVVLQKVLPKLRGTDGRMHGALTEFLNLAQGTLPLSHAKATRMHAAGTQHGFVSFH